jgi:hypothetical protein
MIQGDEIELFRTFEYNKTLYKQMQAKEKKHKKKKKDKGESQVSGNYSKMKKKGHSKK